MLGLGHIRELFRPCRPEPVEWRRPATPSDDLDALFLRIVLSQVPPSELNIALRRAGYLVNDAGRVIQKPGVCPTCHHRGLLQAAYNSPRFLCPTCALDELAST